MHVYLHAQIITAGWKNNDHIPHHVFQLIFKGLKENGKTVKRAKVVVLGRAYRENVGDMRKTLEFSKKWSGLDDQMTLFYAHFNFCRPRGSLKNKDECGI